MIDVLRCPKCGSHAMHGGPVPGRGYVWTCDTCGNRPITRERAMMPENVLMQAQIAPDCIVRVVYSGEITLEGLDHFIAYLTLMKQAFTPREQAADAGVMPPLMPAPSEESEPHA